MPATAPVRLPTYDDELTPAQIQHLRRGFPVCTIGFDELCTRAHSGQLTYLERRCLHYDLLFVQECGPPTRQTSITYQQYLAWACGVSFRRVALALGRAELVLAIAEELGRAVDMGYAPMVNRDLLTFSLLVR